MMKSRSSCLNKRIILDNTARCWPLSVLVLIISFIFQTLSVYETANTRKSEFPDGYKDALIGTLHSSQLTLLITSFAAAYLMFRYLFSERLCNQIHSFPLKRKTLFFSNALSGFLMLIVPQIINWLIMIPAILKTGCLIEIIDFIAAMIAFTLIFYSIGIFTAMITGNLLSMALVYAGINFFDRMITALGSVYNYIFESNGVFGITFSDKSSETISDILGCVMPVSYSMNTSLLSLLSELNYLSTGNIRFVFYLVYSAVALLLLFASYKIYKRRQLEKAGSSITSKHAKPVVYLITEIMVTTLLFDIYLTFSFSYFNGIVCAVLFLISGVIVSIAVRMILDKTVKINFKTEIIRWLAASAVLLIVFTAQNIAANRYIPKEEKIEKIYISRAYNDAAFRGEYSYIEDEFDSTTFVTDPDDIRTLLDIHKSVIDNKKLIQIVEKNYYTNDYENYYSINYDVKGATEFTYILKNGSTYYRYFRLDDESVSKINKIFDDNPSNTLAAYLHLNDIESTHFSTSVLVGTPEGSIPVRPFELTQEEIRDILKAYALDMKDNPTEEGKYYISITALDNKDTQNPGYRSYSRYTDSYSTAEETDYWQLQFWDNDKHTIAAINKACKKYGFKIDDLNSAEADTEY